MAGLAWGACLVGAGLGPTAAARAESALDVNSANDLNGLSIEELARIDVSSVSKSAQPLSDAPAAIFVITHDDIQLTGATTVPDLLRLAPNLQVAQITANSDAISARGFNGSAANKLLVLVDGRTVYTPFFSGVFWDSLTAPVDDIDRVEVISGPGATLWGANAVNGVINITSKKSSDTQGGLLELGGGNLERQVNLRYGGRLSDDLTWRAYVGASDWSHSNTAAGLDAHDGWNRYQGGFRADWARPKDLITVQGDVYRGAEEQQVGAHQIISGDNLLGRWTHHADDGSTLQVQAYYDYLRRSVAGRFADYLSTYDLDVQHSFTLAGAHQIVWGGGYRITRDDFDHAPAAPHPVLRPAAPHAGIRQRLRPGHRQPGAAQADRGTEVGEYLLHRARGPAEHTVVLEGDRSDPALGGDLSCGAGAVPPGPGLRADQPQRHHQRRELPARKGDRV